MITNNGGISTGRTSPNGDPTRNVNSRYWRHGNGQETTQAIRAELTSQYAVREFSAVLNRANFHSLGLDRKMPVG